MTVTEFPNIRTTTCQIWNQFLRICNGHQESFQKEKKTIIVKRHSLKTGGVEVQLHELLTYSPFAETRKSS
jgi:hypothetical protein